MNYLILFAGLAGLLWMYIRWIGKSHKDIPNERSSHEIATPTAGGFILPVAVVAWHFLFQTFDSMFLGCMISLSFISLIDDFKSLPSYLRLIVHFLASGLLSWHLLSASQPIWMIPILIIALAGWMNMFNFMDGINGIAGFYTLVVLTFLWFVNDQIMSFASQDLIYITGISILAFGMFNFRKRALVFAGDIGSITMSFILGYLLISLISTSGNWYYLMFILVFAMDSIVTIFERMIAGENIFKPHRKHLYQYLSNEKGHPHLSVSIAYASLQSLINLGLIYVQFHGSELLLLSYSLGTVLILFLLYFIIKRRVVTGESRKLHLNE